jgi:tetratricopeptide (TPR) repeat protein
MLETIREYAAERLVASGEAEAVGRAHAGYYLGLVEASERGLRGAEQGAWLARLGAERDNLRAALAWALAHDPDLTLRLCAAAAWFWVSSGAFGEGRAWAERALALPGAADGPAAAQALLALGILAVPPIDPAAARPPLERAVALLREQRPVDQALLGRALAYLGMVIAVQEGPESARDATQEGTTLLREAGDEADLAQGLFMLAQAHLFHGDLAAAHATLEESGALYRRQGDRAGAGWVAGALGDLARIEGDHAAAGPLHQEALARYREMGDAGEVAAQLHNLAYVAVAAGEVGRARALLAESLAVQRERENPGGVAEGLAGFAAVAAAGGQAERAARLLGAATATWEGRGLAMWPAERAEYERTTARARAQIDEETWARAWDEGRTMTMEQAIEYALAEG